MCDCASQWQQFAKVFEILVIGAALTLRVSLFGHTKLCSNLPFDVVKCVISSFGVSSSQMQKRHAISLTCFMKICLHYYISFMSFFPFCLSVLLLLCSLSLSLCVPLCHSWSVPLCLLNCSSQYWVWAFLYTHSKQITGLFAWWLFREFLICFCCSIRHSRLCKACVSERMTQISQRENRTEK